MSGSFAGTIGNAFSGLAAKMVRLNERIEHIHGRAPELILFLLWTVMHFTAALFHERWFDEAVSWQIARYATIEDILFTVPHYEGHPQLWHLLLVPFAKLGAPYDLSLTVVSYIFMGAAVYLIMFRSSLPRSIRLTMPFTYYMVYQYSVISRPYCIMALALVLIAVLHNKRNEKPLRYVLCLALLCLSSSYGIVIAGGISLVWVFEICRGRKPLDILKSVTSDRRVWCLSGLLVFALALLYMLMPRSDTYAAAGVADVPADGLVKCLFYALFMLPADSVITNAYRNHGLLYKMYPEIPDMIPAVIVTLFIYFVIFVCGRRKGTLLYFTVPFVLFCAAASLYFSIHHIGICFLLLLFWVMITLSSGEEKRFRVYDNVKSVLRTACIWSAAVLSVVMVYQGISSYIADIFTSYFPAKGAAEFIMENGLDKYRIMGEWSKMSYGVTEPYINVETPYADPVNAYAGHNVFFNYHGGEDSYMTHMILDREQTDTVVSEWVSGGVPDILIGEVDVESIYDGVYRSDYAIVYSEFSHMISKGSQKPCPVLLRVYMRTDLAEELGLL